MSLFNIRLGDVAVAEADSIFEAQRLLAVHIQQAGHRAANRAYLKQPGEPVTIDGETLWIEQF